jgi:hypothetical protein
MAFRRVTDDQAPGGTGELVIKYDPEKDTIQYRNRRGHLREQSLSPYREREAKERLDAYSSRRID